MTQRFGMRNIEGYTTVCTQIYGLTQSHPEWTAVINKYLVQNLNAVIWAGHKMAFWEKIETICRFHRLKLSKYITFKNWIVYWMKNRTNNNIK